MCSWSAFYLRRLCDPEMNAELDAIDTSAQIVSNDTCIGHCHIHQGLSMDEWYGDVDDSACSYRAQVYRMCSL